MGDRNLGDDSEQPDEKLREIEDPGDGQYPDDLEDLGNDLFWELQTATPFPLNAVPSERDEAGDEEDASAPEQLEEPAATEVTPMSEPPSQLIGEPVESSRDGVGCVVQFLAVLLLFGSCGIAPPLGTIFLGLPLLIGFWIVGQNMNRVWLCSVCGNRIDSGAVRICPVCRAILQ